MSLICKQKRRMNTFVLVHVTALEPEKRHKPPLKRVQFKQLCFTNPYST